VLHATERIVIVSLHIEVEIHLGHGRLEQHQRRRPDGGLHDQYLGRRRHHVCAVQDQDLVVAIHLPRNQHCHVMHVTHVMSRYVRHSRHVVIIVMPSQAKRSEWVEILGAKGYFNYPPMLGIGES